MNGIVYTDDGVAVGTTNPLPVTYGYSAESFNVSVTPPDAFTAARQVKAATTSKSIYITDLSMSSILANTITLKDSSGTVILTVTLAANTPYVKSWLTPLKVTAGRAVNVSTSSQAETNVTMSGFVH